MTPYFLIFPYFSLIRSGFAQLVERETDRDGSKVKYLAPPGWVTDLEDFQIWVFYLEFGIPWEMHKQLKDEYREAAKRTAAVKNEEERTAVFLKEIEAGNRLNDYVEKYLRKGT